MFLIKKVHILTEIKKINEYLKKCLWMDFTLCQSHNGHIEFFGAIDQTYNNYIDNYEIKIVFEQPYFISSLFSWTMDPSRPAINLVSEDEEYELNTKYKIELGNYLFKINVEDFESPPIIIAAKKIGCEILNENPFSKT